MAEFLAKELFPRVLNMSVTAGLVIFFVLLARLLLRRAPKAFSYALWSVVLFRLLCPVSLPAGFSLLALADTTAREVGEYTTAVEYLPQEPAAWEPLPPQSPTADGAGAELPPAADAAPKAAPWEMAPVIWLAGTAAMAAYSAVSFLRVRRRLVGAVRLRDNIYLADHIPSPFVLGLFRPRIYLPSALSHRERDYIICHEQHHIRRLDHVVKVLSFVALSIHWFNPLVWAAFLLSGKDMEMSCDEAVLKTLGTGIRADYSASLLALATGRPMIAGMPLAFGEGDTKGRIRNLLRWRPPRRGVLPMAALVCVLAAAACAANPPQGSGGTGQYGGMEDYVQQIMPAETVSYYSTSGGQATANVLAAKTIWLEKLGEVDGLAPEGVLEAWTFNYLVQLDADDVMLVGGMYEEDGWYDLEGQGGRSVVALRYGDGSYDILYDDAVNDGMDFYGYHNSYEEALYDWYVREQGLELPLYVEDWTERLGPANPMGNFPVHRYDGNGWYLYIPVTAWSRAGGSADAWYSDYNTGSVLAVYRQDSSARAMADYLVSQGWTEVEGPVLHVCHWESGMEDYYYDAPDGGSYQVRIQWQPEQITDNPFITVEPEVLRAMAEGFTVDEAVHAAPAAEALPPIAEGAPATLRLTRDGAELAAYTDVWPVSNAVYYSNSLQALAWREGVKPAAKDGDAVTLETADGSLTAYAGGAVCRSGPEGTVWLRPEGDYESPYEILRGWFDEVEYAALDGGYDRQGGIVIPDQGQGYLAAAGAYVEAFEGIHLQATGGSKYCYTFVQTQVEGAEETTQAMRVRGEIGEHTYAFYLTTVYVPENQRARDYSSAGNTVDYTGSDPVVPEGAMEYYRCGYVTREADGWHGELVGTGW